MKPKEENSGHEFELVTKCDRLDMPIENRIITLRENRL